jgi:hypothetical protein
MKLSIGCLGFWFQRTITLILSQICFDLSFGDHVYLVTICSSQEHEPLKPVRDKSPTVSCARKCNPAVMVPTGATER